MLESLKNKRDFERIFKRGKSFSNRDFVLRYIKNNRKDNRLGIIVSKKVSKYAVKRNKLRRQIKHFMHQNEDQLTHGFDLIISAKKNVANQDYQTIENSLIHILKKKGLLK